MTDVDMVQSLTGCTTEQAQIALNEHGTVDGAVDALLVKPVVSGEKYIPRRERVPHHDPEQEERCATGRALMDKLTAVSSAGHSKIRSGQKLSVGAVQAVSQAQTEEPTVGQQPAGQ